MVGQESTHCYLEILEIYKNKFQSKMYKTDLL